MTLIATVSIPIIVPECVVTIVVAVTAQPNGQKNNPKKGETDQKTAAERIVKKRNERVHFAHSYLISDRRGKDVL